MLNKIYLVGNPNCGKTTLFNRLTGKTEKVGNRAGVTVESKNGRYKKDKNIVITDLPGTYSLKGLSEDEYIVTDSLQKVPQAIINVVDGTNLGRNLRLTCELTSLKIPMVIAINFSDELLKKGVNIDVSALSRIIGVPVILISARKNQGIETLMSIALKNARIPSTVLPDYYDKFISEALKSAVKTTVINHIDFTDKADKILMNKYLGIPIFIAVILVVYFFTSIIGGFFGDKISQVFQSAGTLTENSLKESGAAEWFIGLIVNALIKGVGAVLSFLPQILVLFFLLEIIEESGYFARAAFLLDGIMNKAGLSGKSLVALGVSCGCAVSGLMTTRTVEDKNERRLTIFLTPFMPCGAKTAVFAWFSGLMFGGNPLICASMYFLSVISVILFGAFLQRFKRFKGETGLLMEIPVLRLPTIKGVLGALKDKTLDFMLKAGSIIFIVSTVIWFLQSFGISGYTTDITKSFLFIIGDKLKIIFVPLGFGNWQSAVAVITSVFAKEAVIQTLTMVSANPVDLFSSSFSAYAFMAFVLLAPPCVAALSVARNELKNRKEFWLMIVFQTSAAYLISMIINLCGIFISNFGVVFILLTIAAVGFIISIIILIKRHGCKCCAVCGRKRCKKKKANTTI